MPSKKNIFVWILLLGIVSLAFIVRIVNITQTPAGIYPDEAVNGIDAYKVITGQQPIQWFYTDNQGREGLFMNLIALSFWVSGISVLGLKIWSILFGTLTVLGTYLLSKELFHSRKAGLIAAFLVAAAFWAINFSRISFRANMLPFVLVFSFYFLFLGLRIKKYWPFIIGGLIFGIGLHTYIAFRIAPAILLCLFLALWASRKNFLRRFFRHGIVFLFASLVSASPMIATFFAHPEFFSSRTDKVSIFSPEINHGHPYRTLAKTVGITLQQYNIIGDMNWRHNYPPYPIIHPIVGVMFLLGIAILCKDFAISLYLRIRKGIRSRRLEVSTFLLSWLAVMHAPEFLTDEGLPHALRAIGALPAVFIIASLPIVRLLDLSFKQSPFSQLGVYLLTGTILLFTGTFDIVKYHVFWANRPEQYRAFQSNLMDIVSFIHTLPKNTPIVVITGNMERVPIRLFTTDRVQNITLLHYDNVPNISIDPQSVIILTETRDTLILQLKEKLGDIAIEKRQERMSDPFFIVTQNTYE